MICFIKKCIAYYYRLYLIKKKYSWNNIFIDCLTINNISLTDLKKGNIKLWKHVSIWQKNILIWKIEIGDFSYINWPNSILYASNEKKIKIWKYCSISWWVNIIASNKHDYNKESTSALYLRNKYLNNVEINDIWADIIIGDGVWIWANVIILYWSKIGDWAVIWAWSVIPPNSIIEPYTIRAGNPVKLIKRIKD